MKQYTKEEENRLKELTNQGKGPRDITNLFPDRSYSSIRSKLSDLRLKARLTPAKLFDSFEEKIVKRLKKEKATIIELADFYNVGPKTVKIAIDNIQGSGYNIRVIDDTVELDKQPAPRPPLKIDIGDFFGKRIRFGAIADSHIGSKSERLDVLESLYDIFEKEKIKIVFHGGNYVDGEFRFNKFETYTHGFDDMIDNFLKKFPKRKGIKTLFISGDDHEGWWMQREGLDAGQVIMERQKQYGRDDLVYLGYQERDIILQAKHGSALLRIMHGGGGTAYADSYSTQKIAESYQEGEKPHILLVGHYHKNIYHNPRGIHVLQLGCTQDQTRFMRKNKLRAHVGGWIVEVNQSPKGDINRFKAEWLGWWNKGFYESKIGHEGEKQPISLEQVIK